MFVDKLSKKEKIGLSIAIIFISSAFLDRLVFTPISNKIKQLNQEIAVSEKELTRHLRNLDKKTAVMDEYGKYTKYVKKVGSDEEETAKILGEIETLARKSGLYLVDIKPYTPKTKGFYKEYMIEIEAKTNMEALVNFLYQLNSSHLLLRAKKLRLNQIEGKNQVIKASIVITEFLIT